MTVKDGMQARNTSAPIEDWAELDRLAAETGLPRFKVFRAALAAGLTMIRENGMPPGSRPEAIRNRRSGRQLMLPGLEP